MKCILCGTTEGLREPDRYGTVACVDRDACDGRRVMTVERLREQLAGLPGGLRVAVLCCQGSTAAHVIEAYPGTRPVRGDDDADLLLLSADDDYVGVTGRHEEDDDE
jgi:hypothetical protein